jgi:hypothetical protein|tara:strand:+ start:463 stop:1218 length:756 start_codon:yes stop_codon:yes gene_type:complete
MYNVPGADSGREWIEIYNSGNSIDISDWKFFEAGSNHKFKNYTDNLILEEKEYAIIVDNPELFLNDTNFEGKIIDSSWQSLSNSGEPLVLKTSKNGTIVVNITYQSISEADGEGESLQLINNSWQACEPTPGKENFCQEPEEIPEQNETEIILEVEEPELTEQIAPTQTEFNLKEEIETLELEENESIIIQPEIEMLTEKIIEPPEISEPRVENKIVKLAYESENKGFVMIGFYLFLLASLSFNIIQLISK